MNSFEFNKILGAVLGTCLFLLVLNLTAGAIFSPDVPAKPGFDIAVKDEGHGDKPGAVAEPDKPVAVLLASASVDKGATAAKKCAACHTFDKGGSNKVGPNLFGIVNRARASEAGFAFSDAMKAKGGTWTYEDINKFLKNPKGEVAGTKMAFAGIARDTERADVIAYLRSLADNPAPLPQAADK